MESRIKFYGEEIAAMATSGERETGQVDAAIEKEQAEICLDLIDMANEMITERAAKADKEVGENDLCENADEAYTYIMMVTGNGNKLNKLQTETLNSFVKVFVDLSLVSKEAATAIGGAVKTGAGKVVGGVDSANKAMAKGIKKGFRGLGGFFAKMGAEQPIAVEEEGQE
ncbi:MAG: hypothetical protein NWF07_13765 [Candidatus Bathyarchaeota archaeon]|nr:hypothetical protein [Candidatus Bathyarchaeota archaeon]